MEPSTRMASSRLLHPPFQRSTIGSQGIRLSNQLCLWWQRANLKTAYCTTNGAVCTKRSGRATTGMTSKSYPNDETDFTECPTTFIFTRSHANLLLLVEPSFFPLYLQVCFVACVESTNFASVSPIQTQQIFDQLRRSPVSQWRWITVGRWRVGSRGLVRQWQNSQWDCKHS